MSKQIENINFWGITTYFNPERYKSKYQNYKKFRENSKKQGLKLIAVECVFGNNKFELSNSDADIVVRVKSDSVMWQKERLLNIALKHIPKECTKIAWLDADIIFLNDNWISDTIQLLDRYKVLQLFDIAVRLKNKQKFTSLDDFKEGTQNGKKRLGFIYKKIHYKKINYYPSSGFAWAIRRDIVEKVGFYDKAILGGGDSVMIKGFIEGKIVHENVYSDFFKKDMDAWVQKIYPLINANVYYVSGIVLHLFHGEQRNRLYRTRYKLINGFNFDPNKNLVLNEYDCWEWNIDKNKFKKTIKKYFKRRSEDANLFGKVKSFLKIFIKHKNKDNFFGEQKFNWKKYLELRPDLKKNWNGPVKARMHWILFGKKEIN